MSDAKKIRIRVGGVYIDGSKILLVEHHKNGQEYFLLPGGGCEFGETFVQALERELEEEAGLKTKTGRFLFMNESIPPDQHRHIVNLTFLGTVLEGEAHLAETSDVLKGVVWVEKERFKTLRFFPEFKDELLKHWDSQFTLPPLSIGNLWND